MPRSLTNSGAPSQELRHFTNRKDELEVFHRALELPAGAPLPVLMFYGVGGIGKSWLLRRLRNELADAIPSALLDFDSSTGGNNYHTDSARSLAELRRQLPTVVCPRFDLAYAWLRHKDGAGDEPLLLGSGAASTAYEVVKMAAGEMLSGIPGSNLLTWLAAKASKALWNRVKGTWLEDWLASQVGQDDFGRLRRLKTPQEIYPELSTRLLTDLAERLPARSGKACRCVFFLDTFEALRFGVPSEARGHEQEQWVRNLHVLSVPLLLVIAGRDRLRWQERDPGYQDGRYLDQHLVGGLSELDADHFLQRCGVSDVHLRNAVLRVSIDTESEPEAGDRGYHPFSLGLCADAVVNEQTCGKTVDPASFDMASGDIGSLAHRFLKSLADRTDEVWVKQLALTPRFDEDAARTAFSPMRGAAEDAAWQTLLGYSFVREADADGWWSLHGRMRDALTRMASETTEEGHLWWDSYWRGRSRSEADDAAGLAWYQRYAVDWESAGWEWLELAKRLRRERRMIDHERLLGWWEPIGLLSRPHPTPLELEWLASLGSEYCEATLGDRADNLRRAITCYAATLRIYTLAEFPWQWAMTQHDLGIAYQNLPVGDRAQNLRKAIACYAAALRIFTEADFPAYWAMIQVNLGIAYGELPVGDRAQNLRKAIACYAAALCIRTEADFPAFWATTQLNLGNAYGKLPVGDRADNLRRAIACYACALRIYTEAEFPAQWTKIQNNLGVAYADLSAGDRAQNLQKAIACYGAALRVSTEVDSPADWAMTQLNLGITYARLPAGDRAQNLQKAIACYTAALRIYTLTAFPADWASIQVNLGFAYNNLPVGDRAQNVRQAIACFAAALRIYTLTAFPADWAMIQNNLGLAYADLQTGDRAQNLQQTIACHAAALRVYTEADSPTDWARTQHNLGIAYQNLPSGDRTENLRRAIASYEAALRVRTEVDTPVDWATTQHTLGIAFQSLSAGDRIQNYRQAITCYAAALRIYTEVDTPVDWAMIQNNLGVAYAHLPTGDRVQNLQKALSCYAAALRIYTEADCPAEWAATQFNLGVTYDSLGDLTPDTAARLKALKCFDDAVRGYERLGLLPEANDSRRRAAQLRQRMTPTGSAD